MLAFAHVSCVSMLNSLAACSLSMSALPSAFCLLSASLSFCLSIFFPSTHTHTQAGHRYISFFLPVTNYAHINFYKTFLALPFYFMFLFVTTVSHTHASSHPRTHTQLAHALNALQFSLRTKVGNRNGREA